RPRGRRRRRNIFRRARARGAGARGSEPREHPDQEARGATGRRGRGGRRLRPVAGARRAPRDALRQGDPAAANRVHVPQVLPGQAPEPAGGQEADVLPRLRVRPGQRPLPVALGAAAAAGALASLANPPADLGPLALVALVSLVWALGRARPERGAMLGLSFSEVYDAILLSWLLAFGPIAWLPLVVVEAG